MKYILVRRLALIYPTVACTRGVPHQFVTLYLCRMTSTDDLSTTVVATSEAVCITAVPTCID
jgi:hypothetical protein